jgi:hypothetical protein
VSDETVRAIVIALLGTGGATFIWTVVKSVIAYRNSAEGREDKAVARLEQFEADCREQLSRERLWGSYWQRRAATLEYLCITNGVEVPPKDPPPEGTL